MADTRILIVEDETIVAMDVQRRLQNLGYETPMVVPTGEEAIEGAKTINPDIILMDIMLQGEIDGIEAAQRIQESHSLPIIYLTAYADEDILQRAKITEPFGYILKPFEDRELHTCIEMALYKHATDLKLQENERWHATTLRSIGDAVISTDTRGRIRLFNPVAEALTGISAKQALDRQFSDTIHMECESDGRPVPDIIDLMLRHKEWSRNGAMLLQAADGQKVPVDVTISPIEGAHTKAGGVVMVIRDISAPRRAEEALRRSVNTLRQTLEETVKALALTTEKRDPYTAGHQQRVARLANAVGTRLNFQDERLEGLRVAALLHDLGKIFIPAEILSKPARLTDMEMAMMRTHSEVGYDILRQVSFPWPVADVVLQHHERMDGSGYPNGIEGGAILEEARIIMVADVVEAMSSHRPYRAALGLTNALEEIESGKGSLYDHRVVDACLDLFRNQGFRLDV